MDTKIKAVSLKKRLVTLFFSMLSISAFTFGGGFVIVTLMKRRFVDDLEWLDENEMLDMTAIAQSCPGAIAVNGAILVGQRVAGAAGIIVATVATIIPPMVILSLVSYFYALFADNPYVAAVLAGRRAWRRSSWTWCSTSARASSRPSAGCWMSSWSRRSRRRFPA